jgi:simple sugar transport system substrate-binding protein
MGRHLIVTMATVLLLFPAPLISQTAPKERPLRFIFISPVMNSAFFGPVKKGMRDAAARMRVQCTFTGTLDVNVKKQAQMVKDAIDAKYDGIALNIIDPVAFDEVAKLAAQRGIPLVAFNVDDNATPNARLSAVCQNLYQAGRAMGRSAAPFIPPNSRILMTMHDKGVSALEDRLRGAQEVLKDRGVTWKVIITGSTAEISAKTIAAALQENPDVRAVLCTGQADTEGAGLAIERGFRKRGCWAAGFDLSPQTLRLIESGVIRFTIDQQPYLQGFYPVVQLALRCRYGLMPSNIDTGAALITRSNAAAVSKLCKQGYR